MSTTPTPICDQMEIETPVLQDLKPEQIIEDILSVDPNLPNPVPTITAPFITDDPTPSQLATFGPTLPEELKDEVYFSASDFSSNSEDEEKEDEDIALSSATDSSLTDDDLDEMGTNQEDDDRTMEDPTSAWKEVDIPQKLEFLPYLRKGHYLFSEEDTPIQIFLRHFSEEVFQEIVFQTNKNSKSFMTAMSKNEPGKKNPLMNRWHDVTVEEIKIFVALSMIMGIVKLPAWRDYWLNKSVFMKNTLMRIMTFHRFNMINRFFQVWDSTDSDQRTNQFEKVKFFNRIIENFNHVIIPNECLSLDERLCAFKGRFHSKVYMPLKPDKWGIKLICLCDSNGYAMRISIIVKGISLHDVDNLVDSFLTGFEGYNHKLFMDNYYCHPSLCDSLIKRKIFVTGTVRDNRRDVPQIVKDKKLKKGQLAYFEKPGMVLAKIFEKKKPFMILTNFDSFNKVKKVNKPDIIENYNKNMKGVDILNQYCSYYRFLILF